MDTFKRDQGFHLTMICFSSSEVQPGFAFALTKRVLRLSRPLSILLRHSVPSGEVAPTGRGFPSQACSRFSSKLDWTACNGCSDWAYSKVAAMTFA